MANQYHFLTRWRVKGTAEEVYEILSRPDEYARWWPSVFLEVRELPPTNRISLLTRGWLPYTLRWQASVTEFQRPASLTIRAKGDFEGRGIWSIVQDRAFTDITFNWRVTAEKPILRYFSVLLGPAFAANHRWAMQQGRQSLELELARYRAGNVADMNAIGPPARQELRPGTLAGAVALTVGLAAGLLKTKR